MQNEQRMVGRPTIKRKKLRSYGRECNQDLLTTKSNLFEDKVKKLRTTLPHWDNVFCSDMVTRTEELIRVTVLGQPLCERYSWGIPNERALGILTHLQPLVEIGCGLGYWAALLRIKGVDIIAFDMHTWAENTWTDVKKGGPKKLSRDDMIDRNLFLCYPDEDRSLALKALKYFQGEYIIHVGELMSAGGTYSQPQAPFGRTTGADFQVALATEFHCLLVASIPRFPFSKDCISVWKRTAWVPGRLAVSELHDPAASSDFWAAIPENERLPVDSAAPCLAHLLE